MGQIELHLTASAASRTSAEPALERAVGELQTVLGSSVYSVDGRSLEAVVGDLLRERSWTIAAAESCTGGLFLSRLTDVPGSSSYVDRGVVCYSNDAKTALLGIPPALMAEHGAVSEPVAAAMAQAIRSRAGTRVGVGITGIAGPSGGTLQKPVGTVAIAVALEGRVELRTFHFIGAREQVKYQATQAAMNMLRLLLTERQDV
jgi:nicotinamide-nucleotide amidase